MLGHRRRHICSIKSRQAAALSHVEHSRVYVLVVQVCAPLG